MDIKREWMQGFFGCFDNCGLSVLAFFCPCYVLGKNAEALGESCIICGICSLTVIFGYAAEVALRSRLRERRGIAGSLVTDMAMAFLCPCCALVQEAAEVRAMQASGSMALDQDDNTMQRM